VGPRSQRLRTGSRGDYPIAALTSKQRARLRAIAHPLKPVLQIGAEGVSASLVQAIDEAFNTRELFKIKILEGAPLTARDAVAEITDRRPDVHIPQVIGRTLVLYRPFPEHPEIRLPR
jgi:RNA-binding protein